jgi:hypothetical protein
MFPLTLNGQQYLNKDFNDLSLTSGGWTTKIIIDTTNWFVESFGADDFVKITNYTNGNVPANTWYISPTLNLSSSTLPLLSFETIMKWPGPALTLHISTDYDGISNPTQQGTWTDITSQALWDTDNTTWGNWTPSGDVDLTSYISDSTYIAYEYIGSSNSGSTWEIDNIKINEGSAPPYCFSSDSIYQSICYGDSLFIDGSYQLNSGYFNDTLFLADVNGCDSIVTTVLTFLNPVTAYNDTVFLTGCDSLLWKGKIYTVSGNYYDTIYSGAVNGCDSLIPLYLTINNCSSCNTVYYSDTLNTFVSDTLFQSISPQLYFISSDTFPQVSNPNCDSVVEIWREYVYYPNYCSDTITYYDTTYISISVSDTLYIDITVSGVTNISNTLSVYPNPASGVVIIDNGNYSTMSNYSLVIVNSLSQQVFSSQINTQQFQIPVSTLGAVGTYFVQIFDGNNNLVIIKYLVLN